ncbi:unnamed protein product, partial [Clonostachys rhizophaga]
HDVKPNQIWDRDIYKVVEVACYFLTKHADEKMRATVEEPVRMIQGAQYDNGYINSFYTVRRIDQRWTNLRDDHELYCLGYLLEATVAYETLAKSGRLLKVANKISRYFITERGRRDVEDETFFDEEAFARGADPYKDMGTEHKAWFQNPRDYAYHQADESLIDSSEVRGHSVRAM